MLDWIEAPFKRIADLLFDAWWYPYQWYRRRRAAASETPRSAGEGEQAGETPEEQEEPERSAAPARPLKTDQGSVRRGSRMGNTAEHDLLLALTAEWFWERGLLVLIALITGCLLGLPGGDSWRACLLVGTVSGLFTLAAYGGSIWFLADPRRWVLLLVLFASVLLAALGYLLRVVLPIALGVVAMEER